MSVLSDQERDAMQTCHFRAETLVRATAEELFRFHENPENVAIVMPPTTRVTRVVCSPTAREGDVMEMDMRELGLIPMKWKGRWKRVEPHGHLVDEMIEGPFKLFEHHHVFEDVGDGVAKLTDTVYYAFGSGMAGRLLSQTGVRLYLHVLFAWRHRQTRRWFASGRGQASAPSR